MEEKKKLKNEYAVGESFPCGKIELECVAGDSCLHCYFGDLESCDAVRPIVGECAMLHRSDGTGVVFKEVVKKEGAASDTKKVNNVIPERKVGEVFLYKGALYQCLKDENDVCKNNCALQCLWLCGSVEFLKVFGYCESKKRSDGQPVYFVKLPNRIVPLSNDANIGDIVEYKGDLYKIEESDKCGGCEFYNGKYASKPCSFNIFPCSPHERSDNKGIIFVKYDEKSSELIRKHYAISSINKSGQKKQKKTYFEIGEEFSYGLVRLRCEEDNASLCQGCYFENWGKVSCRVNYGTVGNCSGRYRPDKKSVIFKKVEE